MTRQILALSLFLLLVSALPAAAQQVPNRGTQPGYGQAGAGQPRGVQAQPARQPVRAVAGEEPVRQPAGPQPITSSGALNGPTGVVLQPGPAQLPAGPPPGPVQPSWIPLDANHEKWINNVLAYWEARSNKIKAFSCEFVRWEYDPVFGPKDPETAKTIAKGEIKYAQPDKGLFKVVELSLYAPPKMPGAAPEYVKQDATFGEHWVSNGERVFEFDARGKRMIERELPPEMKNKAIADGPLPFMFGARAETIKARYWIRGLPQSGNGKYWLEAVPKSRQDAQNFKAVTIVLDEKTYLPELLEALAPNFDAKTNPARSTYQFSKQEVTEASANPLDFKKFMALFAGNFANPALPRGWTRIVEKADGTTRAPTALAPGVPGALEATKPQPSRNLSVPR
jgi:TIGR03009 family protein